MTNILLLLTLASLVQPSPCKPQFAPLETGASSAESDLDHWRAEDAGSWAGKTLARVMASQSELVGDAAVFVTGD